LPVLPAGPGWRDSRRARKLAGLIVGRFRYLIDCRDSRVLAAPHTNNRARISNPRFEQDISTAMVKALQVAQWGRSMAAVSSWPGANVNRSPIDRGRSPSDFQPDSNAQIDPSQAA
jgi:hypothetical protein